MYCIQKYVTKNVLDAQVSFAKLFELVQRLLANGWHGGGCRGSMRGGRIGTMMMMIMMLMVGAARVAHLRDTVQRRRHAEHWRRVGRVVTQSIVKVVVKQIGVGRNLKRRR
jgi:hypothetical protein